jgi:hypothetical protein
LEETINDCIERIENEENINLVEIVKLYYWRHGGLCCTCFQHHFVHHHFPAPLCVAKPSVWRKRPLDRHVRFYRIDIKKRQNVGCLPLNFVETILWSFGYLINILYLNSFTH